MSPANVYRFFKSKSAINEAICCRHLGQVEALARGIAHADGPAADRLRTYVACIHEQTCDRYMAEKRLHDMVAAAINEHWSVIGAHKQTLRGLLRDIIADGAATGEFAVEDVDRAAGLAAIALLKFCHPLVVAEHIDEDLAGQAAAMAEFLIHALRAGAA
jgi:AcrR family transcriptional regulator